MMISITICYSGTNKLSKVTGSVNQYAYDANGNMTRDDLNKNFDIIYDHRNLIMQLKQLVIEVHGSRNDSTIYKTYYYYDESGNRIRKKVYNDENDSLLKDIIYSRDVSGKEMAIYENGNIKQWNIWGMDNAGFINANGDKRFYLKDHLGSVRAVIDEGGSLVSAQDYDAWGYQLQDRSYNSEESKYKFTSKERDDENKYDYFGARYYDARVGRWGQTEPLIDKYTDLSPYNYSIDNPTTLYDELGLEPNDDPRFRNTKQIQQNAIMEIKERYSNWFANLQSGNVSDNVDQIVANILDAPALIQDALDPNGINTMTIGFLNPITLETTVSKFVLQEYKGSASELGLEWVNGSNANAENAIKLGKQLGDFLGETKNIIQPKPTLTKFGNINKFGKEVRIGKDVSSHIFHHIDIERKAISANYKNLKLQIKIDPF